MIDTLLTRASKSSVLRIACLAALSMSVNPALAAPTPTQLVEAITSAKVLPASVAMNARYSMGEVQIYMYRSGRVPDGDLKIDSVLVTKALRDKFGDDIKSVQLNFYDKDNKVNIRQCTVNQTHVNSFASKQISQQQLLDMLTIARMSATGSSGGSGSVNASKQAVLNATCVDGFEKRKREMTLLKIKDLAEKDGDYSKIWQMFSQMENMVRSGQVDSVPPLYNDIESQILIEDAKCRQKSNSAMQASESRRVAAQAQASMLSYNPPWGFGFARRRAIWARVMALGNGGTDVAPFLKQLQENVDRPLSQNNIEAVKAGVIRLEQQLGLPGSYTW